MKRNFLVVAANARLREALVEELSTQGHSVTRAGTGSEAEKALESVAFEAVFIEAHLPDVPAPELKTRLLNKRPDCPVIVLSNYDLVRNSHEQLRLGHNDYLLQPRQLFDLLQLHKRADAKVDENSLGMEACDALIQVIDVLVGLIELEDRFFGGTSHKTSRLVRAVAEEMGADEQSVQEMALGTLIRDIGKVGVDPEIFTVDAEYTDEQKEKMKEHVTASLRLFEHIEFPWKVLPIVRHHHERYDGQGYPDALRGREIPLGARIVAVVDAYVAMTSARQHRSALGPEQALQEMIKQAGKQFDPEVVEGFQNVLDKRLEGRSGSKKPSVLIVDEQENFRRLLKMRFVNEGLQAIESKNYDKALSQLLKQPPDLVLVDVDGDSAEAFELFQEVRADEDLCRIPFAFMSAGQDRVLKIRALRQGVDEFLSKTDDLEELVARVENILTREAIRQENASRKVRRGIHGDLENLSLPDIIQTLAMGMKTACLTVTSDGNKGQIWFDNGSAKHAQTDQNRGEEAFYEMCRWLEGQFVIEHGEKCEHNSLQQDAMFLLMEGLRLLDEAQQAAS
ncbi:MAG: response regulator [bacterium]|nr:response regulator [bacterium]